MAQEVRRLKAQGQTNDQIADALLQGPQASETHPQTIHVSPSQSPEDVLAGPLAAVLGRFEGIFMEALAKSYHAGQADRSLAILEAQLAESKGAAEALMQELIQTRLERDRAASDAVAAQRERDDLAEALVLIEEELTETKRDRDALQTQLDNFPPPPPEQDPKELKNNSRFWGWLKAKQ